MTCGEVRECLFAFLDNELDGPLSIELQRHLDGCPACAREAEIERTVRKRLVVAIEADGGGVPAFDDALGESLYPTRGMVKRVGPVYSVRTIRWAAALATAAALALLIGAVAWLLPKGDDATDEAVRFADLVVADFEHFLEKGSQVQITSTECETVARWLRAKTAIAVALPTCGEQACELLGGRKCSIAGQPAAFAVYELDGSTASLVAVEAERFDLAGMERADHGGREHWVDHCRGYTVVACKREGLVYAAVGEASQEALLNLMSGPVHESN